MTAALLEETPRPRDPQVIVADCGVDACLVNNSDGGVLILSPAQSSTSAIAATTRAAPHLHSDTVRRLVRTHLPLSELDLDEVLPGYSNRWMVHHQAEETRRNLWCVAAWVLLVAVLAGVGTALALSHVVDGPVPQMLGG